LSEATVVAYVTKGGAAATYAEAVADVLAAAGQMVDVIDLGSNLVPDLAHYDNVVLGTGVRIGMVYRRAKRFLRRDDINDKRLAIFLASGIAIEDPEQSKAKFLDPLVRKYDLHPLMCDAFPGRVPGADNDAPDTLDPERARDWARALAAKLA